MRLKNLLVTEENPSIDLALALPCDEQGAFLPPDTPPKPKVASPDDWSPFNNRVEFELADLLYRRNQMPQAQMNNLFNIWSACMVAAHKDLTEDSAPFSNVKDFLATIDDIKVGNAPWQSFVCGHSGDIPEGSPSWMKAEYEFWYRDPLAVIENMLKNPDFCGEFDFVPYKEYNQHGVRRYCDFLSGDWSFEQAVRAYFLCL